VCQRPTASPSWLPRSPRLVRCADKQRCMFGFLFCFSPGGLLHKQGPATQSTPSRRSAPALTQRTAGKHLLLLCPRRRTKKGARRPPTTPSACLCPLRGGLGGSWSQPGLLGSGVSVSCLVLVPASRCCRCQPAPRRVSRRLVCCCCLHLRLPCVICYCYRSLVRIRPHLRSCVLVIRYRYPRCYSLQGPIQGPSI
jgi:hypothetical protein